MATYTETKLVDDLDGGEAAETVEFGLDGRKYEIDLSEANAQRLRDALAEFVTHARKAGGGGPDRPEKPGKRHKAEDGGNGKLDRDEARAIRAWVQENGGQINDRGRVPRKYVQAYRDDDKSVFGSDDSSSGGGGEEQTAEPAAAGVGDPFGGPHF